MPAKCEAEARYHKVKAKARYHKAEAKAKKNLRGRGRTLWGRGQRCRIYYELLIWIQLKKYCNSSHDSVKW